MELLGHGGTVRLPESAGQCVPVTCVCVHVCACVCVCMCACVCVCMCKVWQPMRWEQVQDSVLLSCPAACKTSFERYPHVATLTYMEATSTGLWQVLGYMVCMD